MSHLLSVVVGGKDNSIEVVHGQIGARVPELLTLDTRCLDELIDFAEAKTGSPVGIEDLVNSCMGNIPLTRARPTLLLGWFGYALGTSDCVRMPAGFHGHSLIGMAAEGPRSPDECCLEVRCESGPAVLIRPERAIQLIQEPGDLRGRRLIHAVAEAIIDEVNRVVPAARAAAATEDPEVWP